jgi:putative ABC transport system ATP-binding protein
VPLELRGSTDAAVKARELLGRVGLSGRGHHYPAQLSGGEQQRVALARGFSIGPKVLFADEPTGNLDADTAADVLELLDKLAREAGRTVLMATHSREVIGVADRIFTMQRGALTERPAC